TAELDSVLLAPQPLDAWSRALWLPAAQRIGAERIGQTLSNAQLSPDLRVRAIEVLTELFHGLATAEATLAARDASPFVRARVAWSLGRAPCENYVPILLPLALDQHPLVRRCALEAIADRVAQLNPTNLLPILPVNLGHPDKRVRQAAARLAALLPEASWTKLWTSLEKAVPQARLTGVMAAVWRNPASQIHTNTLKTALAVLKATRDNDLRLQAVRLIVLALGDYHLNDPSVEVYTAYELATSLKNLQATVSIIQAEVRPVLGSGNSLLDAESARLLGMLEDKDTNLVRQVTDYITPRSRPVYDFHYLVVLSRLPGARSAELTGRIAHAILSLDRKLEGQQQRAKQNWSARLSEVVTNLIKRDLQLPEALLKHPDFARPAHVDLVSVLDARYRGQAARLFLAAVQKTPSFPWSGPLIELLSSLSAEEVRPLFRQQWSNFALRDELLLKLAVKPEPIDREKFLFGLASSQLSIVRASLAALAELPRDPTPNNLIPAFHLLRRLLSETNETGLRTNIIASVARQTGQPFKVEERETDAASLKKVYQLYFAWFTQKNPQLRQAVESEGDSQGDSANWNQALKTAKWDLGQPARGERIFVERGCQTCHTGTSPLGPELAGVAGRLSAEELLAAIIYPNRDVAPQYRTTVFKTRDGQTHTGIVSFESADGVIVLTGAASAVRLADANIVARYPGNLSLMPSGLLSGLRPEQLADLHSYLKTLTPKSQ
ncbi:MAG: HEAT repeat domain-containing protein, partial [Verrucomicrobiota bacterium]